MPGIETAYWDTEPVSGTDSVEVDDDMKRTLSGRSPHRITAGLLTLGLSLLTACGNNNQTDACEDCDLESGQIQVIQPSARACEALVEATGGRIAGVDFAAGTDGRVVVEGDRAGVSFVANGADPLPNAAGTVRFTGALKVVRSTCYGPAGDALSGDGVQL